MLNTNLQTTQELEQTMGLIAHKLVMDNAFRQQVTQDSEMAIKGLNLTLSPQTKTQLLQNVKTFLEVEPIPNAAPTEFWGP